MRTIVEIGVNYNLLNANMLTDFSMIETNHTSMNKIQFSKCIILGQIWVETMGSSKNCFVINNSTTASMSWNWEEAKACILV